jgi:hypothetical protein
MKKEMKKEEFKINCLNLWIIVYHSHPINLIPKQHTFRSEYLKNMDMIRTNKYIASRQ